MPYSLLACPDDSAEITRLCDNLPVVQVEALASGSNDDAAASISQFISMDASGKAIIWVTAQATSDTVGKFRVEMNTFQCGLIFLPLLSCIYSSCNMIFLVSSEGIGKELDFGLSPWGKVRLLQQRTLSSRVPESPALGFRDNSPLNIFDDSTCPSAQTCLAIIPGNSSAFLFSAEGGAMKRVVRYGASKGGKSKTRDRWCGEFSRLQGDAVQLSSGGESKGEAETTSTYQRASSYQPAITCISVNNSPVFDTFLAKTGDTIAPLVLAGRSDGSVDLFRLDSQEPIQSWDLSLYARNSKSGRGLENSQAVVYLQWATWGDVGSFIAADATGNVYYFDLLQQANKPIFIDNVNASLSPTSVQLSSCRSAGMSVYLAVAKQSATISEGGLRIRKVDDNVSAGNSAEQAMSKASNMDRSSTNDMDSKDSAEDALTSGLGIVPPQWASWVGRTTIGVSPWQSA